MMYDVYNYTFYGKIQYFKDHFALLSPAGLS